MQALTVNDIVLIMQALIVNDACGFLLCNSTEYRTIVAKATSQ